jgi:hypothetical protein
MERKVNITDLHKEMLCNTNNLVAEKISCNTDLADTKKCTALLRGKLLLRFYSGM